jgi:TPR repeat protein
MEQLIKAAEQGDVKAQLSLSYRYDKGIDVDKDDAKSAYWAEKAAEQGNGRYMKPAITAVTRVTMT